VRTRLDKKGFSTPEDAWFRTTLRQWTRDILASPSLADRGFTDPRRMMEVFDRHVAGDLNASTLIWRTVNVELWARMFLDPAEAPSGPTAVSPVP
jgi:asparagine synthase (glutamine-hydrolysing)